MSMETLYIVTGLAALIAAVALGVGGWQRGHVSTPAARSMALSLALWFTRYAVRVLDTADGRLSKAGEIAGDARVLAVSTALLAVSALVYATERAVS